MGKSNKVYIQKFSIAFILLGIIFFHTYSNVFAYTDTKVNGGVLHYPLIQGEKIELIFVISGYSEPVFKVEIIDNKGNIRMLTDDYKAFIQEDDVYNLKFEEEYTLDDKSLKVYIQEKDNHSQADDYELDIKINIKRGIKADNIYEVDNERIGNIKNVYDKNGIVEEGKVVDEGLLEYIFNKDNLIGDNIKIKNKEGELYKLHVYDIERNNWIIDDEEYRKDITWKPEKDGMYFLDLWIKSNESKKKFDRWVIIPVKILGGKEKAKIDYIIPSHDPIIYKDKLKFYIKSSGSDRFQYRAFVFPEEGKYFEITDGYSEFIDEDEVYELEIDKNIGFGDYKLWVWARTMYDDEGYTTSDGKHFSIQAKPEKPDEYFDSNIIKKNKIYKTGKEITINGIEMLEFLDSFNVDYMYKLRVLDVNRNTWIDVNDVYQDTIKWVPEEQGVYLLYLDAVNKNEIELAMRTGQEVNKAGTRIEPIIVKDEINNKNNSQKYTMVKTFEELSDSVAKDFLLYIDDDKIEKAYMKALEVIKENIDENMTDLEKLIILNDYIVKNAEYNTAIFVDEKIPKDSDSFNLYGLLIDNLAVCQGYADGMKVFLDLLGIPNRVITGETQIKNRTQSHIWNVVKIDGKEYHLDPTWNDPIPDKKGKVSYAYFLVDDAVIDNNHTWDKEKFGALNNKEFSYFRKMIIPVKDGKWLYYLNIEDSFRLYKIKIDGTENTKLTNESILEFLIEDDWIFFSSGIGGHIYRVNKDGLGAIRINNEASKELKSKGEWITYKNIYDGNYYKVKKDGSMKLPYEG
ncbi:DUF5050 domain-containing protein [Oceanirhabdus seepicola]|uniref:DUF5050 domain-containing protein n=1 Tax=Oceanirhabdus seepicola TaxID=2828781 RepID=A0A9J6P561_9CLOT|nr:DUF5050 domain-containing protein [Oceanirhabdus seepicola]MCM1991930.1 DUF5050 domain-containing protein [Oceanirhabdus seepicola]